MYSCCNYVNCQIQTAIVVDCTMLNKSVNIWKRSDISTSNCSEKPSRHVHCPCSCCNGRATDRGTELRHYNQLSIVIGHEERLANNLNDPMQTIANQSSSDSDSENEVFENSTSINGNEEMETDDSVDSNIGSQDPSDLGISQHANNSEFATTDEQNDNDVQSQENPMRKVIVNAVLDALKIKRNSGVSIETFEDILDYAKRLLLSTIDSRNIDLDEDVFTTLWPKSWNDVLSLLREEGYEGAKQYYICMCYQEKRVYDSSEEKKLSYDGKYSIMENKDDVCIHCGKNSYLTYYYLGLGSQVKNWFRSKPLCEQMQSHWKERNHWLGRTESWNLKKEIWDGQRWVDFQWFWDPQTIWLLPTLCPSCGIPVSSDHLTNPQIRLQKVKSWWNVQNVSIVLNTQSSLQMGILLI